MSNKITASVRLDIEVYDMDQLKQAAAGRAVEDGLSIEDWEDIRRGPGDDLRMLLDPGIVAGSGFSIIDSTCETN